MNPDARQAPRGHVNRQDAPGHSQVTCAIPSDSPPSVPLPQAGGLVQPHNEGGVHGGEPVPLIRGPFLSMEDLLP